MRRRKIRVLRAPEILIGARRLIAVGDWNTVTVQFVDAVDDEGVPCLVTDPRAQRFSLLGALVLTARDSDWEELARAINAVVGAIGASIDVDRWTKETYEAIRRWEDTPGRTIAEVNNVLGLAWKEIRDGKQTTSAAQRRAGTPAVVG